MQLDGKLALVTGGAQGIGRVISEELAGQGAHVVLGDVNLEGAEKTATELKQTGAKVKGITLSENQYTTASKRAQEEGLSEKVTFKIQDYRNISEKYDRIVSVGMYEHVGIKFFNSYLKKTYEILKDSGEIGNMEYDIFEIQINSLKTYEKELIKCNV